jgi:2,3-bisphosphoglycerate-independent phosphoglycerate mutase
MKYVILIGDGMSDEPVERLGNKTPLEAAKTPAMDSIAGAGTFGLYATVPEGYPPGSDVANLSILGFSPAKYYSGRAPLEAASIGVELCAGDVAYRCNLVTLVEEEGTGAVIMGDYSAGHISTEEAAELVRDFDAELGGADGIRFYPGTSYRHLMVWEGAPEGVSTVNATPPHDISDRSIEGHLPVGPGAEKMVELMALSQAFFADHPVNKKRIADGKRPATSIWLWGQGLKPAMTTMKERFGVEGSMISAVDLMKGIGIYAGLEVLDVPGVTGYIDTNYDGKVSYAIESLEKKDFVCIHVEAPDEAGHQGSLEDKMTAIEDFDSKIVAPVLAALKESGTEFTVLVLNDHPTPVELKTHTSDPVPFARCTGAELSANYEPAKFSENGAKATGLLVDDCDAFIGAFFGKR